MFEIVRDNCGNSFRQKLYLVEPSEGSRLSESLLLRFWEPLRCKNGNQSILRAVCSRLFEGLSFYVREQMSDDLEWQNLLLSPIDIHFENAGVRSRMKFFLVAQSWLNLDMRESFLVLCYLGIFYGHAQNWSYVWYIVFRLAISVLICFISN